MKKKVMLMNILFSIYIALLSFGCSSSAEKKSESEYQQAKEISVGYDNLKLIGELEKACKSESNVNKDLFADASKWSFSVESASNLIKRMRKVEANEWYALCTLYPCWYEGKVSNGEIEYEILINAGGYVTLTNKDETLHFIFEKKSNLFIAACDCCE